MARRKSTRGTGGRINKSELTLPGLGLAPEFHATVTPILSGDFFEFHETLVLGKPWGAHSLTHTMHPA